MATNSHNILTLSIKSLLNGDDQYIIPVYQRNFAWQEAQITQLIQDIIDYIPKSDAEQDYYIGTLVAHEIKTSSKIIFETIDGQQRVTTLTLLTSTIRHFYPKVNLDWYKKINIEFESRSTSSDTLNHIYNYGKGFSPDYIWNQSLLTGFELCKEILKRKLVENKVTIEEFCNYLFERVKILRVTVPEDTDLNHYFEIMNNRGEQLEKHEILKSKFLEILNDLDVNEKEASISIFNLVWEACSNMERYIQYGFNVKQRNAIFGENDWNTLQPADFFELITKLNNINEAGINKETKLSVTEIIAGKKLKLNDEDIDEAPERFNSVINFPNFLLHVLRVYTKHNIPLDDKRLIKTFETEIKNTNDKIKFVQEFGFELLRCKYLFDKYVIKREFIGGNDRWSLKRLKWYKDNKVSYVNTFGVQHDESDDDNRSILMLLSMFHVSTPTLIYKHWLNAALYFLVQKNDFVDLNEYKNYLIAIARSFVFDRFLKLGEHIDYFDIIYKSDVKITRSISRIILSKLVFEEGIENIVFNYLDFLLWQQYKNKNRLINNFEYSFRSSVEHYYPRNPMPGYKQLDEIALNSFGNLCLISHSKNSRLSNQPPIAKFSHYKQQSIDSIKQWIMMEEYNANDWNEEAINDHKKKMIEVLVNEIDSDYSLFKLNTSTKKHQDNKALKWFNQYKNDSEYKKLLARALICFDDISEEVGSTYYLDEWHSKYFLYDWDNIKNSDAFKKLEKFISENNPNNLSEVIRINLKSNKELINDPYRFAFVNSPEIIDYCGLGYFTWVKDGNTILLHERERNTEKGSRDLIIHLLGNKIKNEYGQCEIYISYLKLYLDYDSDNEVFYLDYNNAKAEVLIDLIDGKLKCLLIPYRNSPNATFIKALQEYGWINEIENQYQKGNTATIGLLSGNYSEDTDKAFEKIKAIFKNGLGIKL